MQTEEQKQEGISVEEEKKIKKISTIVMIITLYVVWIVDNQTNTLSIFAKNNKTL